MENMDKGLAVPKWVLIPQMPQNLSAQAQNQWKKALSGVRSPWKEQSMFMQEGH